MGREGIREFIPGGVFQFPGILEWIFPEICEWMLRFLGVHK